jgi:hypothetical protein
MAPFCEFECARAAFIGESGDDFIHLKGWQKPTKGA